MFNYSFIDNTKQSVVSDYNFDNNISVNRSSFYKKELKIPINFYNNLLSKIKILLNKYLNKNNYKNNIIAIDGTYSNTNILNNKSLETSLNMGYYDATNHIPINLELKGIEYKNKEIKSFIEHLEKNNFDKEKVILVFDRAYFSYDFINKLNEFKLNFVIRSKNNSNYLKDSIKNKDNLNKIGSNKELLEIFDEQSLIWWNKKDLIKIIKNIVEKFINKNSNTFNISINFKMGLKSLIDKPKELLELINECLKPKEIEKKKFGEVYTPMNLVNDMLDKLPKEVWENKNLKWLDPCVGMGNFMIGVYLRLIEGLKKEIPDEKKRKKHILEKMIYMCELNKKNCYIVKQIFNINNEYKLNIYEGDFLKFKPNIVFKIEKFDIIVGNPPYNKDDTGNGNMIWHLFVEKALEELLKHNGYLCFVHPSLWRKPQSDKTRMKKYFNLMTKQNQMLYLEIHNTKDGLKTFGCGTRYDYYVIEKKQNIKKVLYWMKIIKQIILIWNIMNGCQIVILK
jgi:hypothetical protein